VPLGVRQPGADLPRPVARRQQWLRLAREGLAALARLGEAVPLHVGPALVRSAVVPALAHAAL
jgi:hypothetical protein